jgi:hypothetical protein
MIEGFGGEGLDDKTAGEMKAFSALVGDDRPLGVVATVPGSLGFRLR